MNLKVFLDGLRTGGLDAEQVWVHDQLVVCAKKWASQINIKFIPSVESSF
jgi:hypothetical protein